MDKQEQPATSTRSSTDCHPALTEVSEWQPVERERVDHNCEMLVDGDWQKVKNYIPDGVSEFRAPGMVSVPLTLGQIKWLRKLIYASAVVHPLHVDSVTTSDKLKQAESVFTG